MDKKRFQTIADEMAYWTMIETAAKAGTSIPDHDCKIEGGCQIEKDYQESRAWWVDARNFMKHEN